MSKHDSILGVLAKDIEELNLTSTLQQMEGPPEAPEHVY